MNHNLSLVPALLKASLLLYLRMCVRAIRTDRAKLLQSTVAAVPSCESVLLVELLTLLLVSVVSFCSFSPVKLTSWSGGSLGTSSTQGPVLKTYLAFTCGPPFQQHLLNKLSVMLLHLLRSVGPNRIMGELTFTWFTLLMQFKLVLVDPLCLLKPLSLSSSANCNSKQTQTLPTAPNQAATTGMLTGLVSVDAH